MSTQFAPSILMSEKKLLQLLNDYFSLTKPRLSSLVIFTSALGLALAPGEISFSTAIVSILATSGLVGGACVINCYMERDLDALMERTKDRPLPSGRIAADSALAMGQFMIMFSLWALFAKVNPLTAGLGFVATLTYIFLYTPMKKKTSWALFAGAIPGALPPLMGWTSVTNSVGGLGVALFSILFIWQLPHFLSISLYHARDYNNADFKIYPTHIGVKGTVHRIVAYTMALFLISLAPYYLGVVGEAFKYLICLLGGSYFIFALTGYKYEEGSQNLLRWARQYFYASLVYLPCVFVLLLIFK